MESRWGSGLTYEITSILTLEGLTATELVRFEITELDQESDGNVPISETFDLANGHWCGDGTHPYVEGMQVRIISIDANKAGTFRFKMQCRRDIEDTWKSDRADWECRDRDMGDWRAKLIDYAYGGSPSRDDCTDEMSSGVTYIDAEHVYDMGETLDGFGDMANGGIMFDLKGPDDIYNNAQMILIIRRSYERQRYWIINALVPE